MYPLTQMRSPSFNPNIYIERMTLKQLPEPTQRISIMKESKNGLLSMELSMKILKLLNMGSALQL